MTKYFAYGANCNPEILEKKGVRFRSRVRANLRGYRLLFNKKSLRERLPETIGFANINIADDGCVEGVLYDIVDEDMPSLDRSERHPDHYDRIEVAVETQAGSVTCWAYKAQPDKIADGLVPSRNYLNHILSGRDFLSRQYFEALDQSQTYQAECGCCQTIGEVLFVSEASTLHALCQPCGEARVIWGDVRGRSFTVAETKSVMLQLVLKGPGFASVRDLIDEAIRQQLISP